MRERPFLRIRLWAMFMVSLLAGCTFESPDGTVFDLEGRSLLKPFELRTLDGQPSTLSDHLGSLTLVAFFFPT